MQYESFVGGIARYSKSCGFAWVRFVMNNKKKTTDNVGGFLFGDPYGNRTHAFAVRGRRLSRLTKGPYSLTCLL